MPHVVVGGDNPDAYAICDAIEQKGLGDGLPVVFCTTPHEVVGSLSRAEVALFVLNFEQAGLTNFELACRLRESPAGAETPILLPEVDALGDLEGTLGKHVGVVAYPVDPEDVAAQAVALIKAAALRKPAAASAPAAAPAPALPSAASAGSPGGPVPPGPAGAAG
ncbi:MAG: hypothetical protein GX595_03845, partial [Lentisphaerae bacterium]|nr:hypothetical protein [Lentisphaerota bacterium]